eukprot:Protomagalhaensia_sp_Gyna_25__5235@NODE_637_length_2941_cov_339_742247_g496_i0_p1_GENE_NODE_637_length_2941_cov_339_742247_g496_i0NODE_637_length_2941_cov_339_742247_g496_i0_p1_ORF_typecomplete_len307_score47_21UBX/PF00789_20/21UBX/PF00789_20/5_7ESCRTII/PF05871_12/0_24Mur_ligase_M/PF08245_12/0_23_NODE_637_length_2941_cov_339_742247_g496_i0951015
MLFFEGTKILHFHMLRPISTIVFLASLAIAKQSANTPVLLWSSNPELFKNEEISRRVPYSEVFEYLEERLNSQADSAPFLLVHMLPRGIKSSEILTTEDEQPSPARVLNDPEFGSHALFPSVSKQRRFDLTEEWADLFELIHIPPHEEDKKRMAILTNREVIEDEEAYKVVVPASSAFTFDTIADRLGDTRILLVEAASLLESSGKETDYWTVLSALIGETDRDLLVISADIDPPAQHKGQAARRRLQQVPDPDAAVILNIKPVQMAVLLFLGAFTFAIASAVMCTMQINTPTLYLEKPIPINKEF